MGCNTFSFNDRGAYLMTNNRIFAKYYRNTGEWISWDCVDKTDLLWSGLFSVVGPSGISSLKKIFKGLVHGTAAGKNVAKSHLKLQATWQGSKNIHKSASNIGGSPCGCN